MSGKMKGIIGGALGLVLILVIALSLGGGSITPKEFAERSMALTNNVITTLETAENKDQLKSLYKETLSELADMIPGALVGAKEYVEDKGGIDKLIADLSDDRTAQALRTDYAEEFKDIIAEGIAIGAKMEAMDNRGFANRMENIFNSFNDLDFKELTTFTIDEAVSLIDKVAGNEDAIEAINWFIKAATPEYDIDWVWDEKQYDYIETKTKLTPTTVTEEMLNELSNLITREFANITTPRDIEDALDTLDDYLRQQTNGVIDF